MPTILMNIYASKEIQDRWVSHEFRGKIRKSRLGLFYIEAYHKTLNNTFFYVFGADSCIDIDSMKIGAPELIFSDTQGLEWAERNFPKQI